MKKEKEKKTVLGLGVVPSVHYLSSYLMTRIKGCATADYKKPMYSYVLHCHCTFQRTLGIKRIT